MKTVKVRGDGTAAYCCARLLRAAGFRVMVERENRVSVPAIMLSPGTQRLAGDVFARRNLFDGLHRIESRIVAWGRRVEPVRLPHSAVVVSEQQLAERIGAPLSSPHETSELPEPDWTVLASRAFPRSGRFPSGAMNLHGFGSRMVAVREVQLAATADASACGIESLAGGWLFLIPCSTGTGWLLAVGDSHEALLAEKRLIGGEIHSLGRDGGQFPGFPRISDPICGSGWLACGSAAVAFDPVCGDGTGNAIREAILVSAVIRAIDQGVDPDQMLGHYRSRLVAGLLRHLELCRQFYGSGHGGPWWEAELEGVDQGIEWCKREMEPLPERRYRLEGFELRPI